MSFVERFLDKMKFGDDDRDEEEYDEYDEEEEVSNTIVRRKDKSEPAFTDDDEDDEPAKPAKPVKPARTSKAQTRNNSSRVVRMNSSPLEVCVIKPTSVEDGREIADTLISGRAVVLNLEGIEVDQAQRIIDFASGACFAIKGNLQVISKYIFIMTPESVDISGDFQGYISTDGAFAQELKF